MLDTPNNLTRNILLGMFAGFVVGAFFYYTNFFSDQVTLFVEKYIFVLGGVMSGLGKGIAASSIGYILKNTGLKVGQIFIISKGHFAPLSAEPAVLFDRSG